MILVIIYVIVAYHCLSALQQRAGIFYFGSLSQYFMTKFFAAVIFGWAIIPIWIIAKLLGKLR